MTRPRYVPRHPAQAEAHPLWDFGGHFCQGATPEAGGDPCGCGGWGINHAETISLVKCAWNGATCAESSDRPACRRNLHRMCMHDAVDSRFCCTECEEASEADATAAEEDAQRVAAAAAALALQHVESTE